VTLKLRKLKKAAQPLRYDMGKISIQYKVEISNRFQAINLLTSKPEELWREFKQKFKKTTEAHVPVLGKRHKAPWILEAAVEIANQKRKKKMQGKSHSLVKKKKTVISKGRSGRIRRNT